MSNMKVNAAKPKLGDMPLPTTAPRPSLVRQRLEVRAGGDQTCGYVDGSSDNAVVCTDGWQCAKNPLDLAYGCCPEPVEDCVLPIACLDATDYCDSSCITNPYIIQCPSSFPYCASYIWDLETSYMQIFCDKSRSVFGIAAHTYSDELGSATVTSDVVFTLTGTSSAGTSKPTDDLSPPTAPVSTSASTPVGPETAVTSSPTSSSSPVAVEASSGLSTGAIAGIAVGGAVAGIGLLVGALLLFLVIPRRRRSRENAAAGGGSHAGGPPYSGGAAQPVVGGGSAYGANQASYAGAQRGEPVLLGTGDPNKAGAVHQQQQYFEYDVAGNPVTTPSTTYAVPSSPQSPSAWEKGAPPDSPNPTGPKY